MRKLKLIVLAASLLMLVAQAVRTEEGTKMTADTLSADQDALSGGKNKMSAQTDALSTIENQVSASVDEVSAMADALPD